MLPSKAGKKIVCVILYDILTHAWAIFIEFVRVLLPAKKKDRNESFPSKKRKKIKYMIVTHVFRCTGQTTIITSIASLQTSRQMCFPTKTQTEKDALDDTERENDHFFYARLSKRYRFGFVC